MNSEEIDNNLVDNLQDDSTITEGSSPSSSSDSFGTVKQDLTNPLSIDDLSGPSNLKEPTNSTMTEQVESRVFGDQIQKYSQIMNNALSKYKVSDDLNEENYIEWSQSLMEVFCSLELHEYFKLENYRKPGLSEQEHEKTRFNLTTFVLHCLDTTNSVRTRNHLTDPHDACEIIYNP
ncbi:uncharacterized protein MELLADRAFT_70271 [Melampsora larici-populina 98AG31]|uniref:Uncharacterized protein n=1 Tax=Melampsora larici-populina (strain 98AG31 / pathotype 3-4-7) TaxID=747676 RepID=F4SEB0_MELLP|nr:uncharacterized protein MELLADRAFT_70271 [Melampsora larici-populina 98AG31]EGF97016.1 hypothetical protein MELLADRAFT_70271 [Melampsora larici-populina 98AG31]